MLFNSTSTQEFADSAGYFIGEEWMPRVTKIVEIKAKPALYRYYAKLGNFALGEKVKELSASEGTLVHNAVEALLLGEEPQIPLQIQASVSAFCKYVDENNITVNPEYIEYRLAHTEYRYAGTLDAIATIGGKTGILDIKTSQAIYRDYNLQTSAYFAVMRERIPALSTRWILRIDQHRECQKCGALLRNKGGNDKIRLLNNGYRNGSSKCLEHEWGEMQGQIELKEFPYWEGDFEAFLGAKRLWEWENEPVLKQIGYL